MLTFHYDDVLNAGERHISSLNPLSIEHEKNIIIAKENQTVNYFRSHFAPPKSAQTPTNYTSKGGKSIQLFEFGGAFVIPTMCCQAHQFFSARRFQDRSRFCKFSSKPTEENIKLPHRNLDKITQVFYHL